MNPKSWWQQVPAKLLLVSGIGSSLLYLAMNIFLPMRFEGYNAASQTVSELSAIGAPTRQLWVSLGIVYSFLVVAFGWGVWKSAGGNKPLRAVGGSMAVDGVISLYWPPMHLRGAEFALTDSMHIIWSITTVLLMMLALGFGAAAFGKRFRIYSIATMGILVVFGALTGLDGPRIAANLPTPRVGIWERISIAAFILWVVVLAMILLRDRESAIPDDLGRRSTSG
jgi:hypothetical protein